MVILFLLFRPYLTALIIGAIVVIFFYPLNKIIQKHIRNRTFSSLVATILVTLIILIPSLFLLNAVAQEAVSALRFMADLELEPVTVQLTQDVVFTLDLPEYSRMLSEQLRDYFSNDVPRLLGDVAQLVVGILLMFFLIFYGFKDGDKITSNVMNIIPLTANHKKMLSDKAHNVLYGVMYGQVLVAVIEGMIGMITFMIFGVPNPIFWGFIMALLSFIPGLGPPLVWVPAVIFEFLAGNLVSAIGVALVGVIIIMNVDNILKPKIIGTRTGMHPLLVVISIFGGLALFGLIGFIIGPILAAVCALLIQFFNEEFGFSGE